ncbi:hypothetical protein EDD21DRAFT_366178 [Dissophora ornata]|nr:basic helix-loop-helix protein [Dissophora ornata]KAI8604468.1 hypothetical protein EDD21DRAFT_366178 [Dissophora ornata]
MTSSSEIHVQEVLNNLTNSIKRDGMEKLELDETFTAVIAQHTAAQVQAQAQAQTPALTTQEQHDQQQVNQDELERIAQEHQQQQKQLALKHEQAGQDSQPHEHSEQPTPTAPVDENTVIHVNTLDPGNSTLATVPITATSPALPPAKPASGSEEWHKMRRDNHKEVERRRRENINAGIKDLEAVIPNPDKNKGAILRQAVNYIQSIHEAHQKAVVENEALKAIQFEREKALLEKNVAQNQLQSLIAEHDRLKRDYEALRKEVDELEESKKRQRTE